MNMGLTYVYLNFKTFDNQITKIREIEKIKKKNIKIQKKIILVHPNLGLHLVPLICYEQLQMLLMILIMLK